MRTIVLKPGEQGEIIELPDEMESQIMRLQEIVGGWIEHVVLPKHHNGFINEEGKFKDLPWNHFATELCRLARRLPSTEIIVGPMVIVGPVDNNGDQSSVTDEFIKYLKHLKMVKNGK